MSIVTVREFDLDGMRTYSSSLGDGEVGKRTFFVQTSDGSVVEPAVMVASAGGVTLPLMFELFPGSTRAFCHKITPTRERKDTTKWLVVCEYKSTFNNQEIQLATAANPIDRATAISGQSRTIMMPSRRLLKTAPYLAWVESGAGATWALGAATNSAKDPLDPPIDVAYTEWQLHCEKNVSAFPAWFLTYKDGVNIADQIVTIQGTAITIPKACAKLENFTFSTPKRENGTSYITIGWNTIIRYARPLVTGYTIGGITGFAETDRFGPWDEERLDEGMRTYDTATGKWVNVPGNISLPIPFDGSGKPINVTGAPIAETDLWWIAYRPFGARVDYSLLPWS